MRILNAEQIRAADQYTITHEPINSIDLMERASIAFVEEFVRRYPSDREVWIFCGTGNNGGDGLAIARLLDERSYQLKCWVCGAPGKGSPDFLTNYDWLPVEVAMIEETGQIPEIDDSVVLIDGLFGSGLNRPLNGLSAVLVQALNASGATIVAIDIASGLYVDRPIASESAIIRPQLTISFQVPKLAFFQPELAPFVGEWHIVDIQLDRGFVDRQESDYFLTERVEMKALVPDRPRFMHKGDAGRAVLWAGTPDKMGAALLAARSCLRSGVGLLWMLIPQEGLTALNVAVPESMVTAIDQLTDDEFKGSLQVLGIGPGIGTSSESLRIMERLLKNWTDPVVLDADAITLVAQHPDLLATVPPHSVLTPHPGEFRRLVGSWRDDYHKLDLLRRFCIDHKLNIVLKGAYSAVCNTEGQVFFNPTGNAGMATGGTGDVLFGIVCGLQAQGLQPADALRLAVFLHGLAGDLGKNKKGMHSLLASDIIRYLPNSFVEINS